MWNTQKPRIRLQRESDFIYSIFCRDYQGNDWRVICANLSNGKFKCELLDPTGNLKYVDEIDDPEEEALFRTICLWVDARTAMVLIPTADPEYGGTKTKPAARNGKKQGLLQQGS